MMKYCAIVDGCSTGKYYPFYLKKNGYQCIHIQSTLNIPKAAKNSFNPNDYVELFVFQGDHEKLITALSKYPIEFIIPGSEPGVELADNLSTTLNLYPNELGCGKRCRDKFLTGEALRKQGVRSIKQQKIKSIAEAILWAETHNTWPLVIKPLDSGGGDGFYSCQNVSELTHAVRSVLGSKTIFDKVNEEILIQEFIAGTEYVVNTVSCNGRHFVESFMVYEKQKRSDGRLICETENLMCPSNHPQAEEMFHYTFTVLDALGVKYGAAHNELMLTAQGPVLMECNGRPHGNSLPKDILTECLGHTQVELTALSYSNQNAFLNYLRTPRSILKHMTLVHLIFHSEGIVQKIDFMKEIENLPSFHSHRLYVAPGEQIGRTIDLPSSPGNVFLCSENREQIRADIKKLREYETEGIFKI